MSTLRMETADVKKWEHVNANYNHDWDYNHNYTMTIGYDYNAWKITWQKLWVNTKFNGSEMRTDTAHMIEKDLASAMQNIRARSKDLSFGLSRGILSMQNTYYLPREQTGTTTRSTTKISHDLV